MPPPIRYPLPTLIVLLLVGLLAWRGEAMTRPIRSALADRWRKAAEGPPIPSSDHPQVVAGPIVRKGLLLREGVEARRVPGGPVAETIRRRMFVDVYDVWPLRGRPESYRVGNRRPFGWVEARDFLPWSTRLVVALGAEPERGSSPAVGWDDRGVDLAVWPPDGPWGGTAPETRRVAWSDLPPDRWGAWLSREELLGLLGRLGRPDASASPDVLRLRALLGRLVDDRPISADDVAAARKALPPFVLPGAHEPSASIRERLARINEGWEAEASWGGVGFRRLPLSALP